MNELSVTERETTEGLLRLGWSTGRIERETVGKPDAHVTGRHVGSAAEIPVVARVIGLTEMEVTTQSMRSTKCSSTS
jgi:hypothetical protein